MKALAMTMDRVNTVYLNVRRCQRADMCVNIFRTNRTTSRTLNKSNVFIRPHLDSFFSNTFLTFGDVFGSATVRLGLRLFIVCKYLHFHCLIESEIANSFICDMPCGFRTDTLIPPRSEGKISRKGKQQMNNNCRGIERSFNS